MTAGEAILALANRCAKSAVIKKIVRAIVILVMLSSCSKRVSWCEQWEVELYEKTQAICPTGRLDTVTVCFNSADHDDMLGALEKVDSLTYRMYKALIKRQ